MNVGYAVICGTLGHEQQRVVGARPEDQDDQDPAALAVDDQAVPGQLVDRGLGHGQRDPGGSTGSSHSTGLR